MSIKEQLAGLVEAAKTLGHWATLRDTEQSTIEYWEAEVERRTSALVAALSQQRTVPTLEQVAAAIRKSGHVSNSDKWEVAEDVMALFSAPTRENR